MKHVPSIVLAVSLFLNALFGITVAAALNAKTASLSIRDPGDLIVSAAIAGVPEGADAVFGPLNLTLETGQNASLQYSVIREGKQANLYISALYDHRVVSALDTGFGITISAVGPGETALQIVTSDGFHTLAVITVSSP